MVRRTAPPPPSSPPLPSGEETEEGRRSRALIIKFPRVVRQRVDRFLNFPSQESFSLSLLEEEEPLSLFLRPSLPRYISELEEGGREGGAKERVAGSPKTEGKINKVEEQSKLNGVMLLPRRKEEREREKASKGGLYYNGVSSLLCHPLPFSSFHGCLPPLVEVLSPPSWAAVVMYTGEGEGEGVGSSLASSSFVYSKLNIAELRWLIANDKNHRFVSNSCVFECRLPCERNFRGE